MEHNKRTEAMGLIQVMVAMGLNKAAAAMEALKVMMAIELNKDMAAVAAMETRRGMADMEAIVVHIVVDRADTSTCQVCLPMEFVRYE